MRSPYFFVLIFSKLETIFKINQKYFEKSLQKSKIGCIFVLDKQLIISLKKIKK